MLSFKVNHFIFVLVCVGIISVSINYLAQFILAVFILLLIFIYKNNFVLSAAILSFLVLTRNEFEGLRDIITFISTLSLFIIFFQKYGLKLDQYPKVPREVYFFLTLLFFSLFISTLLSTNISSSLNALLRLTVFFIICYILFSFMENKKSVLLFISVLLVTEMIIGLSILYDFMRGGFSFFLQNGILARFTGIYDNPNFVGLTTLITTCLIIALYFLEQFNTSKRRFLLFLLLLNNVGILLITDSRAAIITVLISSFIMLYLLNKKMLLKVFLSLIIISLVLLAIPVIQDFILILLRPREFSAREHLWNSGVDMFRDHLMSGVGPEQFPKFFYTYLSHSALMLFEETGALTLGKIPSPHNYFLLMGAENGVLGFLSSISIFILFFYISAKTLMMSKNIDREYYIFSVAIMAIGVGTFLRAFFEISGIMYYGYISRDLPFWIIFLILIFIYNRVKNYSRLESLSTNSKS